IGTWSRIAPKENIGSIHVTSDTSKSLRRAYTGKFVFSEPSKMPNSIGMRKHAQLVMITALKFFKVLKKLLGTPASAGFSERAPGRRKISGQAIIVRTAETMNGSASLMMTSSLTFGPTMKPKEKNRP